MRYFEAIDNDMSPHCDATSCLNWLGAIVPERFECVEQNNDSQCAFESDSKYPLDVVVPLILTIGLKALVGLQNKRWI